MTPTTTPVSPQPPAASLDPVPGRDAARRGGRPYRCTVPYEFGWLYLDLNTSVAAGAIATPVDPAAAQAFVTAFDEIGSSFAVGIEAIRLDSACAALHFTPLGPG